MTSRILRFGCFLLMASCLEPRALADGSVARDVTFELTFLNHDLLWLGDPASPTAVVFVRPGAKPIASDCVVRTLRTQPGNQYRRYMSEGRIFEQDGSNLVHAFTSRREIPIGTLDAAGRFLANDQYLEQRDLLPSWPSDPEALSYDASRRQLYMTVDLPGPVTTESLDFLPLTLLTPGGAAVTGDYSIGFRPHQGPKEPAEVLLTLDSPNGSTTLARGQLPSSFPRNSIELGSYNQRAGRYLTESDYRPSANQLSPLSASVTISFPGKLDPVIRSDQDVLTIEEVTFDPSLESRHHPQITIDGNFDDWRSIAGTDDPRGDVAPYLEYVADVDLLEFKVASDREHIYFYARVAGKVGRTHPDGGRSYFYAYMDVDRNPKTGFLPTRDDDCYFGVDIGDDCEVQFEFVNNEFRKSFYGFCGLGGDEQVLKQQLTIGKSVYGRFDEHGIEREHYKSEYIYQNGKTEITEDLKLGTSDTIRVAVSPDGSEVEIASELRGFLKDATGQAILRPGQTIDVAAGMECDSKRFPEKKHWAADSTPAIRGYRLDADH